VTFIKSANDLARNVVVLPVKHGYMRSHFYFMVTVAKHIQALIYSVALNVVIQQISANRFKSVMLCAFRK
jgi:hypothetical protein